MRWIVCFSLFAVAACGGGGSGAGENKAGTARADAIAAGQWELTSEVTAFHTVDQGSNPQLNMPVGTRATDTVCVGAGQPPAKLFSGGGFDCRYDSFYGRRGRMNATMLCTREGLNGNIPVTADGQFGADSLEYTREIRTSLAGAGDVQITARVTGRRTGECTPGAEGGNQSAGTKG